MQFAIISTLGTKRQWYKAGIFMTLEQTQAFGWIIGIIIGVVFYAVLIYFDRRKK